MTDNCYCCNVVIYDIQHIIEINGKNYGLCNVCQATIQSQFKWYKRKRTIESIANWLKELQASEVKK